MKQVFIINGPARSGKGTFINMCRLLLQDQNIPVYSFSSIFPIKQKMVEDSIWDGKSEKTTEVRKMMVELKQKMVEEGDIPTQYLLDNIKGVDSGLIFVHIREASEMNNLIQRALVELGIEVQTLHIERLGATESFETGVDHSSETRKFGAYHFDYGIQEGLENFFPTVSGFLKDLIKNFEVMESINPELTQDNRIHAPFNDEMAAGFV